MKITKKQLQELIKEEVVRHKKNSKTSRKKK